MCGSALHAYLTSPSSAYVGFVVSNNLMVKKLESSTIHACFLVPCAIGTVSAWVKACCHNIPKICGATAFADATSHLMSFVVVSSPVIFPLIATMTACFAKSSLCELLFSTPFVFIVS